jgi:hypothetical protein
MYHRMMRSGPPRHKATRPGSARAAPYTDAPKRASSAPTCCACHMRARAPRHGSICCWISWYTMRCMAVVLHVRLRKVEPGVAGEVVGGAHQEDAAVAAVFLLRRAALPHNVGPHVRPRTRRWKNDSRCDESAHRHAPDGHGDWKKQHQFDLNGGLFAPAARMNCPGPWTRSGAQAVASS